MGVEKTKWIDSKIINYIDKDPKLLKLATTVGKIYRKINQLHFVDTLALTYENQKTLKKAILTSLEDGLK
ncbi:MULTISPECIES: hypothetical protein [unclassified Spiroplasma]|uniref:hypothetical protein n=1 Tax=unclassified Spiroplasma TaxID=2637901 RepID=UPI0030CF2FFE